MDDGPAALRSPIQAVDRSVALLDAVAAAGPDGVTTRSLADAVDLKESTARTLLSSLALHGLVVQVNDTKRYRLGPRLFQLNQLYLAQTELSVVAAPVLRRLWEATAETVHLAVLEGSRRVDVAVLVGPQLLNVNPVAQPTEGATIPLERTAAGKVLLAGLEPARLAELRRTADWGYFAAHPRPLAETLHAELAHVRTAGHATNVEEGAIGVCGVAVPVLDHRGRTVAALCVGYPAARHTPEYAAAVLRAVVEAADDLSQTMGSPGATA